MPSVVTVSSSNRDLAFYQHNRAPVRAHTTRGANGSHDCVKACGISRLSTTVCWRFQIDGSLAKEVASQTLSAYATNTKLPLFALVVLLRLRQGSRLPIARSVRICEKFEFIAITFSGKCFIRQFFDKSAARVG